MGTKSTKAQTKAGPAVIFPTFVSFVAFVVYKPGRGRAGKSTCGAAIVCK